MFERFTDRSRRVVVLAQEEARALNHEYVGTEHLLLGLIREDGGVAAQALESLGIGEEAARRQVEEIVGRGQTGPARAHLPFTRRASRYCSWHCVRLWRSVTAMSGEHLLLGLVREDESVATRILYGLGTDPNRIRQQVIRLVSARQIREEPGTGRSGGRGKRRRWSELRDQLDSVSWRLSVLEQRVGTAPDLAQLDRDIAQIRRDRESAIDAQDFEHAAVLRGREQRLADDKAARLQQSAALRP